VVEAQMKNRTKTNLDREITLCPRALEVLQAQLALRVRMVGTGQSKWANRSKRPTCRTTDGLKCWRR